MLFSWATLPTISFAALLLGRFTACHGAANADITIAALLSLLNQAILMGRNRDIRECSPTKCNPEWQDKNLNKCKVR